MKRSSLIVFYGLSISLFVHCRDIPISSLLQRSVNRESSTHRSTGISVRPRTNDFRTDDKEDSDTNDENDSHTASLRSDDFNSLVLRGTTPHKNDQHTIQLPVKVSSQLSLGIGTQTRQKRPPDSSLSYLYKRTTPDEPKVSPSWSSVPGLPPTSEEMTNGLDSQGQHSRDGSPSPRSRNGHAGLPQQVSTEFPTGLYQPPTSTPLSEMSPGRSILSPQQRADLLRLTQTEHSPGDAQRSPIEALSERLRQTSLRSALIHTPGASPQSLLSFTSPSSRRTDSRFFPSTPRSQPFSSSPSGPSQSRFFPETPKPPSPPAVSPEEQASTRVPAHPVLHPMPIPIRRQRLEFSTPSLPLTLSPSPSPPPSRQQQQLENIYPGDIARLRGESHQRQQDPLAYSPPNPSALWRDNVRISPTGNSPAARSPPGFERRRTSYVPPARRRLQPSEPIPIQWPSAGSSFMGGVHQHHSLSPQRYSPERFFHQNPPQPMHRQQISYQIPGPSQPPYPPPFRMDSPLRSPPSAPHMLASNQQQQQPLYRIPESPPSSPPFHVNPLAGRPPQLRPSPPNQGPRDFPSAPSFPPSISSFPPPMHQRQGSPPRQQQTVVVTPPNTAQPQIRNRNGSPR